MYLIYLPPAGLFDEDDAHEVAERPPAIKGSVAKIFLNTPDIDGASHASLLLIAATIFFATLPLYYLAALQFLDCEFSPTHFCHKRAI